MEVRGSTVDYCNSLREALSILRILYEPLHVSIGRAELVYNMRQSSVGQNVRQGKPLPQLQLVHPSVSIHYPILYPPQISIHFHAYKELLQAKDTLK